MIVEPTTENIFEADVDAVVIAVNCLGVAGAGQAKAAKELDPAWAAQYMRAAQAGLVHPDKPPFVCDRGGNARPRYFIAVPTKNHFRDTTTPELLRASMTQLQRYLQGATAIKSIAVPALGAGLGKLDWRIGEPIIREGLAAVPQRVDLYAPRSNKLEQSAAYASLFETPSERPPLPAVGQWHRNWFSNMIPMEQPLVEDGIVYRTVEHYYHASKVSSPEQKAQLAAMSPQAAKRAVRTMQQDPQWTLATHGMPAMRTALEAKFAPGTAALDQLLATGSNEIVAWNNWNDRTWGKSLEDGAGGNLLGQTLMELRAAARERGQAPQEVTPHAASEVTTAEAAALEQDRADAATLTLNGVWPAAFTTGVTTVGSRSVVPTAAKFQEDIGTRLERAGLTARSGGAVGSDTNYVAGYRERAHTQVFLPALTIEESISNSGKRYTKVVENSARNPGEVVFNREQFGARYEYAKALAAQMHPAWSNLGPVAKELMTRNVAQVLGPKLNEPSLMTIEWAKPGPEHSVAGGTNLAHQLSREMGVAIFNHHHAAGDFMPLVEAMRAVDARDTYTLDRMLDRQRERHAVREIGFTDLTTLKARQSVDVALRSLTGEYAQSSGGASHDSALEDLKSVWRLPNRMVSMTEGPAASISADDVLESDRWIEDAIAERLELERRGEKIAPERVAAERAELIRETYGTHAVPLLRDLRDPQVQTQVQWAFSTLIDRASQEELQVGKEILNAVHGRGHLRSAREHAFGTFVLEPDETMTLHTEDGRRYVVDAAAADRHTMSGQTAAIFRSDHGQLATPIDRATYLELCNTTNQIATLQGFAQAQRAVLPMLAETAVFGRLERDGNSLLVVTGPTHEPRRFDTKREFDQSHELQNAIGKTAVLSMHQGEHAVLAMNLDAWNALEQQPHEQRHEHIALASINLSRAYMEDAKEARDFELSETPHIGSADRPILLDVINVRSLGDGPHEHVFYMGRTDSVAQDLGVPHLKALANPYRTKHAGGTLEPAAAAAAFDTWFKGEFEKKNQTILPEYKQFLNHALKEGIALGACHDHPGPCHVDTIVREGAKVLRAMGKDVRTPGLLEKEINRFEERRDAAIEARDKTPLAMSAKEKLLSLGYSSTELGELYTPWEQISGQVIAADEHEFKVEVGNGKWRSIEQKHFDEPFHVGDTAQLLQEDGVPVELGERSRTAQAQTYTLSR